MASYTGEDNKVKYSNKGSAMGRKLVIMMATLVTFAGFSTAVFAVDAPHNETRGIGCVQCHGGAETTDVKFSLFWGGTADEQAFSNLCQSCHSSVIPTAWEGQVGPAVATHSSTTTSTTYGTWSVSCVVCHDPHVQEMKMKKKTMSSDLVLLSGMVTGYTVDSPSPGYSSVTIAGGSTMKSGWTEAKLKNKSQSTRGAVFIPNTDKMGLSFPIHTDTNLGANTIVVEGDLSSVYNAWYGPPSLFIVVYGQDIKTMIDTDGDGTDDADVVFMDDNGPRSFAHDDGARDGIDSTPDGICQVCHTQTTNFRADGTLTAVTSHQFRNGVNCMGCHEHKNGFFGQVPEHSGVIGKINISSPCDSCHVDTDFVVETHGNLCVLCHDELDKGFTPLSGTRGSCVGGTYGGVTGTCSNPSYTDKGTCETNLATWTPMDIELCQTTGGGTWTAHGSCLNEIDTDKATCEGNSSIWIPGLGELTGNPTPYDCKDCHTEKLSQALSLQHPPGGNPDHRLDLGPQRVPPEGNLGYIPISMTASCGNCHDQQICSNPSYTDQSSCEGGGEIWYATGTVEVVQVVHASKCNICHDSTQVPLTLPDAMSATLRTLFPGAPTTEDFYGDCVHCHGAYFSSHLVDGSGADHTSLTNTTSCVTAKCHDGADMIADVHQSNCSDCHDTSGTATDGDLIVGPNGRGDATVNSGGGGTCLQCHAAYSNYANHAVKDHSGITAPGTDSCATSNCHSSASSTSGLINTVHTACASCHNGTAGSVLNGVLLVGTYGRATGTIATCADCHAESGKEYATDYANHSVKDHSGITAPGTATCATTNCHTSGSTTSSLINTLHTACDSCHTATTGVLINGSYGDATGASINACADCHSAWGTDYANHAVKDHDAITAPGTASCASTSCHSAASTTTGLVNTTHACATCHTATTGVLINGSNGTATGASIGTCANCHAAWNTDYANHKVMDHSSINAPGTASCASSACHTAASTTSGITQPGTTHTACASCHTATTGVLRSGTNGNASTGSIANCANCHAAWNTDYANHLNIDHDGWSGTTHATPTMSCSTGSCHTATIASIITIDHNYTKGCDNCHTATTGVLINGSVGDATGGGGQCTACHSATYFNSHTHHNVANDTIHDIATDLMSGTTPCRNCHPNNNDADGTNLNSWTDYLGEHETGCGRCHNYTNGDAQDTPVLATNFSQIQNAGTVKCLDCHTAKNVGHGGADHTGLAGNGDTIVDMTHANSTKCTGCHTNSDPANGMHPTLGCATCHPGGSPPGMDTTTAFSNGNPGDYPLPTGNGYCSSCHSSSAGTDPNANYAGDFGNAHDVANHTSLTDTASCVTTNCHDGADYINNVHDHNAVGGTYACLRCHVNTTSNGSLTAGAAAGLGGGQCTTCHAAHGTNYANHGVMDHSAITAPGTASCSTNSACHSSGTSTTGIVTTTHTGCDSCHTPTTGVLINGTNGNATGANIATCANCHATWGADYVNHVVKDHSAFSIATSGCTENCHSGSTRTIIASTLHTDCTVCHTATTGVLKAGTTGTATGGSFSTCADCHSSPINYPADYKNHTVKDHNGIGVDGGCDSCHGGDITTNLGAHDYNSVGSGYACNQCHTAVSGTLSGSAAGQGIGTGKVCSTCHPGGHDAEADHNNIHKSWTTGNGATEDCEGCHGEMGTSPVTFVGGAGDGIDKLHLRAGATCGSCHSYVGSRTGTTQANVTATINAGKSTGGNSVVNCEGCHVYADINAHDSINAHDYTKLETGQYESEGLSCGRCHHGNAAIEHVTGGTYCANLAYTSEATCTSNGYYWKTYGVAKNKISLEWDTPPANNCYACHTDGAGGVNTANSVVNAAITTGKSNTFIACYDCHNPSNPELRHYADSTGGTGTPKYGAGYTIPDGHHDGTQVQSGNCTYCHSDPRAAMNFPTPPLLPCVDCHAVEDPGDNTTGTLTVYRKRNRSQNLGWTTKYTGDFTWTYGYGAMCTDTLYTTEATCTSSSANSTWLPARAIANTMPSGTCSNSTYNDKKWECIGNGGTWTYDEGPGTGVDHQWTITSASPRGAGSVQSFGMCIFCHKMAPFHAKNIPLDDANREVEDREYYNSQNPYSPGYADAPFHPCVGRGRLAVFHEEAGYENQYYKATAQSGEGKATYRASIMPLEDQPNITLHYELVVYQPQKICTDDPMWKSESTCTDAGGTWDHGVNANKYIPQAWKNGTLANQSGAESEYPMAVPIPGSFTNTVTITDNATAYNEASGAATSGTSVNGSVTVNGICATTGNCDVWMSFAGRSWNMTDNGSGSFSYNTGALPTVGAVYGTSNNDIHFVAVDMRGGQNRKTIGYLHLVK